MCNPREVFFLSPVLALGGSQIVETPCKACKASFCYFSLVQSASFKTINIFWTNLDYSKKIQSLYEQSGTEKVGGCGTLSFDHIMNEIDHLNSSVID
jgi:hypothetical protein